MTQINDVFDATHNNDTAMQKLKGGVIMRPVSQLLTVIAIAVLVGGLQIISPSTVSNVPQVSTLNVLQMETNSPTGLTELKMHDMTFALDK